MICLKNKYIIMFSYLVIINIILLKNFFNIIVLLRFNLMIFIMLYNNFVKVEINLNFKFFFLYIDCIVD